MIHQPCVIDMDGTIYCGNNPTPFAAEFIRRLRTDGTPFTLMTNNPSRSPLEIAQRLAKMGIPVQEDEIVTSADVAVNYLLESGAESVFILGSAYLTALANERRIPQADDNPEYVLIGHTRNFHYRDLAKAAQLISAGSKFLCTDLDHAIPSDGRMLPHTGAMAAYLQAATGQQPCNTGKPERCFLDAACARLSCKPEEMLLIGDNLDTDIAMGVKYGVATALVLTGITDEMALQTASVVPTYVLRDLGEFINGSFEARQRTVF